MSADNYLLIKKEQKYWGGYIESASITAPTYKNLVFQVATLEDAIRQGQKIEINYGINMRFSLEKDLDEQAIENNSTTSLRRLRLQHLWWRKGKNA